MGIRRLKAELRAIAIAMTAAEKMVVTRAVDSLDFIRTGVFYDSTNSSMLRFHQRTLALLGTEGVRHQRSIESLLDWAAKSAICLPAAFLEWAQLDDGSLLRKYSDDDWFWFDEPELITTRNGARGLRFNSENQNNFDRIVTLDQGDDPPVLFAWIGRPPWVKNADRFSDVVFAQVFDWQYWLEFRPADPAYKEITYYGELSFKADRCVDVLRRRYEETVTTQFIVDHARYTEYRFLKSPVLRLTATVADNKSTTIRVTGRPVETVKALETELKLTLA